MPEHYDNYSYGTIKRSLEIIEMGGEQLPGPLRLMHNALTKSLKVAKTRMIQEMDTETLEEIIKEVQARKTITYKSIKDELKSSNAPNNKLKERLTTLMRHSDDQH